MTDNLKPEQRKRVAEAVTGNSYMIVTTGPNGGGMPLIAEEINPDDPGALWKPHKKSNQWKALVTWLVSAIENAPTNFDRRVGRHRLMRAINTGEVETLERMAYETLEAQDD